jgi:hypothetical protein
LASALAGYTTQIQPAARMTLARQQQRRIAPRRRAPAELLLPGVADGKAPGGDEERKRHVTA